MTGNTRWLAIAGAIVVGVSVMTFVTTNLLELLLSGAVFGVIVWQGTKVQEGGKK